MSNVSVTVAEGEAALDVREFSAREALSELFYISLQATSPRPDLDFTKIIGQSASFSAKSHLGVERSWNGICVNAELVGVGEGGTKITNYRLEILPRLYLLALRENHRLFQHVSMVDMVDTILEEHKVTREWRVDKAAYKKRAQIIQYAESDLNFVRRLLEHEGISFFFETKGETTTVVFSDAPQSAAPRGASPIYTTRAETVVGTEWINHLVLKNELRTERVALRAFDPTKALDVALLQSAGEASLHEHFAFSPGMFAIDGGTTELHDAAEGGTLAKRTLEALRTGARRVAFDTNVIDLSPGVVFSIANHPRADVGGKPLVVTSMSIHGSPGEEWNAFGTAVFADVPLRPSLTTPKPRASGVESAVVVGDGEIDTDNLGRVRVQFHWDRKKTRSAWVRVSHAWAGSGSGMVHLPRVGEEVLVGFLESDPDQPVVLSRVHNADAPVPHPLPEHRDRSVWRSRATPFNGKFHELYFSDTAGQEMVALRAESQLSNIVGMDSTIRVGGSLTESFGGSRLITAGESESTLVSGRYALQIGDGTVDAAELDLGPSLDLAQTMMEIKADSVIFTTGQAAISITGPNIALEANGDILLHSMGGTTVIDGCEVHLNKSPYSPAVQAVGVTAAAAGTAPSPRALKPRALAKAEQEARTAAGIQGGEAKQKTRKEWEQAKANAAAPTSETASDRMLKDFDPETRAAVNKSPTMQAQMAQLEKDGWTVQQGEPGAGSFADRGPPGVITIDPNKQGADAAAVLSHEVGHATYELPPLSPEGLTREQYREAYVDRALTDEGNAQVNRVLVRDEVAANGGADLVITGRNPGAYQGIYDEYEAGGITRDEAVQRMADNIGSENPSTSTDQTYRDFYGGLADQEYDDFAGGLQ